MFGIELDLVKKLEIGFCAVALGAAGVFAYVNTRPAADTNIAAYVTEFKVPVDAGQRISATNPIDPRRSRVVNVFVNHDGHLEITEYAPELGLKPLVTFRPENRGESSNAIQNQWGKVSKIADPARRAITFAAYLAAEGRPQNLINRVGLEPSQETRALESYKNMLDAIVLVDEDVKQGLVAPALQDEVIAALDKYRAADGDVAHTPAKAALAGKVMDAGLRFYAKVAEKRSAIVESYVDETFSLLREDQRKKIASASEELATRAFPRRGNKRAI